MTTIHHKMSCGTDSGYRCVMARMSNTRRGHRRLRPWLSEPVNLGLSRQPRWRWLVWLLAVDLALVVIHIINRATLDSRFLRIDIEFGLGEIYQYGKFILIAVIMADLARRSRGLSPLLWALVFAYLALDDALALHESIGANFARVLGSEPGAPGIQVLADLTVTAGLGVVVLLAFKGGGGGDSRPSQRYGPRRRAPDIWHFRGRRRCARENRPGSGAPSGPWCFRGRRGGRRIAGD